MLVVATFPGGTGSGSMSALQAGWTVGSGAELRAHIVRVGLDYRF